MAVPVPPVCPGGLRQRSQHSLLPSSLRRPGQPHKQAQHHLEGEYWADLGFFFFLDALLTVSLWGSVGELWECHHGGDIDPALVPDNFSSEVELSGVPAVTGELLFGAEQDEFVE